MFIINLFVLLVLSMDMEIFCSKRKQLFAAAVKVIFKKNMKAPSSGKHYLTFQLLA